MFNFASLPPLSLYVHLPWCVRKCPYCDFNSHQAPDALTDPAFQQAYVDALLADLTQELPGVWGRTLVSIFIGGGTPSLFAPAAIASLLNGVRALLPCRPDLEVTLEANPGTVEQARFEGFREAGVNRLSIGVQSFDDTKLSALGRIHDGATALRAARSARAAGFDNFNLDLMFGLPDQARDAALEDLATAIAEQPSHLSWYQLTIEPNTLFHHCPPVLPDDDALFEMQQAGQQQLAGAGFTQYEVSAYAQPDRRCRHNLNYWRFGDYLGIGAGAHAKITDAATQTIRRRSKLRNPREYVRLAATPDRVSQEHTLTPTDARFEFLLNALRLNEGFDRATFEAHSGLPYEVLDRTVARARAKGLLEKGEPIRASARGRLFLNELLTDLLPEESADAHRILC